MPEPIDLLARPVYGMSQVDWILRLHPGTASRWIDGYTRGGKEYPPIVRLEKTDDDIVTWGEFTEARLLSEFRDAGIPIIRMRPAVEELRACGRMFEPERDVRGGGPSSDAQSDTRPSCSGISATGP